MKYKYNIGDRIVGIENTLSEEMENIIGKKGTIIGRMSGVEVLLLMKK